MAGQQNETDESTDIRNKQTSKSDKSEHDANIVFECSNHEKIKLQSSLGKLFRESNLVCSIWQRKLQKRRVILYSQTMDLTSKEIVLPCVQCQMVHNAINHRALILILPF